jgi:hypothetical protein
MIVAAANEPQHVNDSTQRTFSCSALPRFFASDNKALDR